MKDFFFVGKCRDSSRNKKKIMTSNLLGFALDFAKTLGHENISEQSVQDPKESPEQETENKQPTMSIMGQFLHVANDLRNTMVKTFGNLSDNDDPNGKYRAKYANFPVYTKEDILPRLSRGLTNLYLENIFQNRIPMWFLEDNGFTELIGDTNQYWNFQPDERHKWYIMVRFTAIFAFI